MSNNTDSELKFLNLRGLSYLITKIKGLVQSSVSGGTAAQANKLATARNLQTKLDKTTAQSFDGSTDATQIGVTGTLAPANGGTGQTTLQATRSAMGLGNTTGVLPIANGGTNANSAANARTNLGLGSAAIYNVFSSPTAGQAIDFANVTIPRINSGNGVMEVGPYIDFHLKATPATQQEADYTARLQLAGGGLGIYINGTGTKGDIVANLDGHFSSAKTISLTGVVSGSVSTDFSSNVTINTTAPSLNLHNIHVGSSAPSSSLGSDGDVYFRIIGF